MKVSVIVPVYNAESVLHYCVDSILNQTFKDFELILVDDGSTDGSGALCDEYASKNENVLVKHIENQGVSVARNTGIELARGEYICFVDSDDYVEKNYLECLLDAKIRYPAYENVWCGFQTVNSYENASVLQKKIFQLNEKVSFVSASFFMTLHEKWLDAGPVCKLYSTRTIKSKNITFPEDLSLGEDLLFNLRYLDCTNGRILVVNQCLYNYYQNNQYSLTKTYHKDMFGDYKRINGVLFLLLKKWNCDNTQFVKFYTSCFYIYEFVLRNTFNPNSNQKNKLRYNRTIMKSEEFKSALMNSDCYINPFYRFGYSHAMSWFIRLLDKVLIKSK